MKPVDDIAVIIQARLGSQRVPRKMLKPFAGTTLLDIALAKLKCTTAFASANIYLCVHEPELVAVGERHGVKVFRRSARSAASEGNPLQELYEWWDRLGHRYAVMVNACLPFLRLETIDAFVRRYATTAAEGLFGVIERRTYFWNQQGEMLCALPGEQAVMNTKLVGVTYEAAHALYAGRLDRIGEGVWMGNLRTPGEVELFPIAEEEALDIDYAWQFELAESLYTRKCGG
jgi:CMP-N-acetylneuraminic acid synthetase